MQFPTRRLVILLGIAVLVVGVQFSLPQKGVSRTPTTMGSPRPLQVSLMRIVGYAVGNDIQGHFQLTVIGPSNLTYVTIHFNQTLVYNTTQSQFSWPFHTHNYPLGWTIIRVQGFDTNDTLYEWSLSRRFVPSNVNTPYWIAALLFIIIFSVVIIIAKIQQLRQKP